MVIGRGRLGGGAADTAARIVLRLERAGARVRALCSADGEQWFAVGETDFPGEGPVQVGVHAIGAIDRTVYPGAHPDGTAIVFEGLRVWS